MREKIKKRGNKRFIYVKIGICVMMGLASIIFLHYLLNTNQMEVLSKGGLTTVFGNTENEWNPIKEIQEIEPSQIMSQTDVMENYKNLDHWKLILVNKQNVIDSHFKVELKTLSSGHKIDQRAYEDLQHMMDDARATGLKPFICSSYRTVEKQNRLYDNKVKSYEQQGYAKNEAKEKASFWVAIPGTSEHQTGLAVDIVSIDYQLLDEKQEQTAEQKWLIENSYLYGFILRYPTNKKDITGIEYEPWHYRYVGKEHAKRMKEKNYVLEEYIAYLKNGEK